MTQSSSWFVCLPPTCTHAHMCTHSSPNQLWACEPLGEWQRSRDQLGRGPIAVFGQRELVFKRTNQTTAQCSGMQMRVCLCACLCVCVHVPTYKLNNLGGFHSACFALCSNISITLFTTSNSGWNSIANNLHYIYMPSGDTHLRRWFWITEWRNIMITVFIYLEYCSL